MWAAAASSWLARTQACPGWLSTRWCGRLHEQAQRACVRWSIDQIFRMHFMPVQHAPIPGAAARAAMPSRTSRSSAMQTPPEQQRQRQRQRTPHRTIANAAPSATDAAGLAPPLDPAAQAAPNPMQKWLQAHGAPEQSVHLEETKVDGVAIDVTVASRALAQGETVLRIPDELVVTLDRVFEDETIAELLTTDKLSELACLTLYLMCAPASQYVWMLADIVTVTWLLPRAGEGWHSCALCALHCWRCCILRRMRSPCMLLPYSRGAASCARHPKGLWPAGTRRSGATKASGTPSSRSSTASAPAASSPRKRLSCGPRRSLSATWQAAPWWRRCGSGWRACGRSTRRSTPCGSCLAACSTSAHIPWG